MMKFAILGSGFGLYGYLPALIYSGQKVILPVRYRERFESRKELSPFSNHIEWQPNEEFSLNSADGVLLALDPNQQAHWLSICAKKKNIKKMLLEKPLASSPKEAECLLNYIKNTDIDFRVGYIFRFTNWGKSLISQLKNTALIKEINIVWTFMAHHFQHELQTWKRNHFSGGGVIRFYAIHLIALLAEIGYETVVYSKIFKEDNEYIKWQGTFSGKNLPLCNIIVDSKSLTNEFCINQIDLTTHKSSSIIKLHDPFQATDFSSGLDRRIPLLVDLCSSLLNTAQSDYNWYFSVNELWYKVEKNIIEN